MPNHCHDEKVICRVRNIWGMCRAAWISEEGKAGGRSGKCRAPPSHGHPQAARPPLHRHPSWGGQLVQRAWRPVHPCGAPEVNLRPHSPLFWLLPSQGPDAHDSKYWVLKWFFLGLWDAPGANLGQRLTGKAGTHFSLEVSSVLLVALPISNFVKLKGVHCRVHLVLQYDGRPTGSAFVEFSGMADAEVAMGRDKAVMGTRYVELFHSSTSEINLVMGGTWGKGALPQIQDDILLLAPIKSSRKFTRVSIQLRIGLAHIACILSAIKTRSYCARQSGWKMVSLLAFLGLPTHQNKQGTRMNSCIAFEAFLPREGRAVSAMILVDITLWKAF